MVNGAAFYAVATLIVGGTLAAIALPGVAASAAGLGAAIVGISLLEALSGAWLLAILQLFVLGGTAAGLVRILRRPDLSGLAVGPLLRVRWWPLSVALGVAVAAVLIVTFSVNSGAWSHGPRQQDLAGLLLSREPVALGVAVVLLVTAGAGSVMAATVTREELDLERRLQERRLREERIRRRREDRLAARRSRRS